MISLDIKSKSQSPTTLNLPTSDEEPKLSFSDLLKGVSVKKDEKIIETTSLVVDIKTDKSKKIDNIENVISKGFKQGSDETPNENLLKTPSTKENFIALLKNETVVSDEPKGFLESTIKQTTYLSTKGLKALVADAKEYLKSKIIQSDGFQKSEIKELPKTLKGLSTLAEKFDINVSKITLEDVKAVDKKSLSESLNSSVKSQTTQDAIKNLSIVGLKSREKIIVKDEKPQELKPLEQMLKLSKDKKIETAEIPKD
ncbi:MAG: hypothetical protein U9P72_08270, partial [Campylobacterota bacterium]|nr:hypothetical protein [Campylobacterota bacterium]